MTDSIPITDYSARLYNEDLAPIPLSGRTWHIYDIFAMWMSDVHSIGGYTFAAGLFFLGLAGWQVLLALIIGIFLVYIGVNLTGYAGSKMGVPYPVVARLSFGLFGANIPALIRAIIAIVWSKAGPATALPMPEVCVSRSFKVISREAGSRW